MSILLSFFKPLKKLELHDTFDLGLYFVYVFCLAIATMVNVSDLELAKNLLSDKGVIFISIDDNEQANMKLLCDDVFGEENFVNDFMWLHGKGKKDTWSRTLQQHTLCYAKEKSALSPFVEIENTNWAKNNVDNDPRGNWFSGSVSFTEKRSNPKLPIGTNLNTIVEIVAKAKRIAVLVIVLTVNAFFINLTPQ